MHEITKGDYVVYVPYSAKTAELGRVIEVMPGGKCRVCYSRGCTSATTPMDMLCKVTNSYVIEKDSLGHNRFKPECEEYDHESCFCERDVDRLTAIMERDA